LLPVRLNLFVTIGAIDLLGFYARPLGEISPFVMYGVAAAWVVILIGLGFAARNGYRWAFIAGLILYGADMIALLVTFSIWAFAVHAVFLFKWFQGFKSLNGLREAAAVSS